MSAETLSQYLTFAISGEQYAVGVAHVKEIIGYEPVSESFSYLEAFRWNPTNDTFEFPGYMNSYLLEQVIAIKRGIPPHRRKEIYDEVKRRAKIFEKLHKERGVTDFHDLFQILAEARRWLPPTASRSS